VKKINGTSFSRLEAGLREKAVNPARLQFLSPKKNQRAVRVIVATGFFQPAWGQNRGEGGFCQVLFFLNTLKFLNKSDKIRYNYTIFSGLLRTPPKTRVLSSSKKFFHPDRKSPAGSFLTKPAPGGGCDRQAE
jgi:hypothetical protein